MTLTCTVRAELAPIIVHLTRERTKEHLTDFLTQTPDKDAEVTHTMDSLQCLDSGVYVCSARNLMGVTMATVRVGVLCR